MPLRTSNPGGGDFELPPEGMRLARCFKIVDMGTHMEPVFGKEVHKANIYFELPTTLQKQGPEAGNPFVIKQGYNLSHHGKANLRLALEGWYGKKFDTKALDAAGGFDLEKLVIPNGRPALLNIVHSEDGKYANIATINPLPEGMECPPQIYPSFIFTLEDFNPVLFSKLSQKMQDYIRESGEYIRMHQEREPVTGPTGQTSMDEEDIPF
jgi:hypothetical protein